MYLYEEVKNRIRSKISSGEYRKGDQIPSEMELAKRYNVSRITVRRALKELESDGILQIRHGQGTFVRNEENLNLRMLNLRGFSELETREKVHFKRSIISKTIIKDKELDEVFESDFEDEYLRLERILKDEKNKPRFKDISYFPMSIYKDIYDKITANISTFQLIKEEYNIKFDHYSKLISVIHDPQVNIELKILPSEPLIFVKKKIYDEKKRVIHYSTHYLIAKEVTFELNSLQFNE